MIVELMHISFIKFYKLKNLITVILNHKSQNKETSHEGFLKLEMVFLELSIPHGIRI